MSLIRDAIDKLGGARGICTRLGLEYTRDMPVPWRAGEKGKKLRWNTVKNGKETCYDFKEGEGGDEVWFWSRVKGVSNRDACRELIHLAGLSKSVGYSSKRVRKQDPKAKPSIERREGNRAKPKCPSLRRAEPCEVDTIAELRGLPIMAIEELTNRGIVTIGQMWGLECWFYRDSERWNVRFRRLDGKSFNNGVKAMALPGSWAARPIGMDRLPEADRVIIVEGEGDGLAAWAAAWAEEVMDHVAVCVMAGSGLSIPEEVLSRFENKKVRIVPHVGDQKRVGEIAALRWGWQLESAGAEVDILKLVKGDLGDLLAEKSANEINGLSIWKF